MRRGRIPSRSEHCQVRRGIVLFAQLLPELHVPKTLGNRPVLAALQQRNGGGTAIHTHPDWPVPLMPVYVGDVDRWTQSLDLGHELARRWIARSRDVAGVWLVSKIADLAQRAAPGQPCQPFRGSLRRGPSDLHSTADDRIGQASQPGRSSSCSDRARGVSKGPLSRTLGLRLRSIFHGLPAAAQPCKRSLTGALSAASAGWLEQIGLSGVVFLVRTGTPGTAQDRVLHGWEGRCTF